jgi:hypothetical protein
VLIGPLDTSALFGLLRARNPINLTESGNQADRTTRLRTLGWRITQRLNPVVGKVSSAADLA